MKLKYDRKRLKVKYENKFSNFAFNFKLLPYTEAGGDHSLAQLGEAGGLLRTNTQLTLNRRTEPASV